MPSSQPTLRDMIQEALDNGATYRELEARAIDPVTGNTASRSVFFDTVNSKLDRMPYEHHLRAIAAGLRVPYERVRQAAIRQWVPPEDGTATSIDDEDDRARLIEEIKRLQGIADDVLARVEGSGDAGERRGGAA